MSVVLTEKQLRLIYARTVILPIILKHLDKKDGKKGLVISSLKDYVKK